MSSKGSICCCRMTVMITSFALIGAFLLVLGLVLRLAVVPDVIRNQVDSVCFHIGYVATDCI